VYIITRSSLPVIGNLNQNTWNNWRYWEIIDINNRIVIGYIQPSGLIYFIINYHIIYQEIELIYLKLNINSKYIRLLLKTKTISLIQTKLNTVLLFQKELNIIKLQNPSQDLFKFSFTVNSTISNSRKQWIMSLLFSMNGVQNIKRFIKGRNGHEKDG